MKFITFFIYIYIILYYIMQLNTASCNYENNYLNTNDYTELKLAYSNLLSRSNLLQSNYLQILNSNQKFENIIREKDCLISQLQSKVLNLEDQINQFHNSNLTQWDTFETINSEDSIKSNNIKVSTKNKEIENNSIPDFSIWNNFEDPNSLVSSLDQDNSLSNTYNFSNSRQDVIQEIKDNFGLNEELNISNSNIVALNNEPKKIKSKKKEKKRKERKEKIIFEYDNDDEIIEQDLKTNIIKEPLIPIGRVEYLIKEIEKKPSATKYKNNILTFGTIIVVEINVSDVYGKFISDICHDISKYILSPNKVSYTMGNFNCLINVTDLEKILESSQPIKKKNNLTEIKIHKTFQNRRSNNNKSTDSDSMVNDKKYELRCEAGHHKFFFTAKDINKLHDESTTGYLEKQSRAGRNHESRMTHKLNFLGFCKNCFSTKKFTQKSILFGHEFSDGHKNITRSDFESM